MSDQPPINPYVPAHHFLQELSWPAVLLGLVLGMVLAAANTYLGLYAGMTVGASIPAAVISMAILRGILGRGTILENNIVQTMTSTGESLAGGVLFTIPALLLTGVWTELEYWPTVLIALTGGVMGILFMIPLRKVLIVENKSLTYPEGQACAQVLIAGDKGGSAIWGILRSVLLGGVIKFFTSGVILFKSALDFAFSIGSTVFYFGTEVSGALIGVGYIIGFEVSLALVISGVLGWVIGVPVLSFFSHPTGDPFDIVMQLWSTKIRYLGVGMMLSGGIWTLFEMRKSILAGLRDALIGYRYVEDRPKYRRTEVNMRNSHTVILFVVNTLVLIGLYYYFTESSMLTLLSVVLMVGLSFVLVAISSYIVGLVGTSNSPVSGMTICGLLIAALAMTVCGITGVNGMLATLGIAGVVCCAICTAGDISQDLKTGYLLGATPRKQQWVELLGILLPALTIPPVIILLNTAYGIGTDSPQSLKAPQATLFASLVGGIFDHGALPWAFVFVGALMAIGVIWVDLQLQKKQQGYRVPVMAFALGFYLPLFIVTTIFIGGVIERLVRKKTSGSNGTLFASGLIAGESLMGVLIAAMIYLSPVTFPTRIFDSKLVGLLVMGGLVYYFYKEALKKEPAV